MWKWVKLFVMSCLTIALLVVGLALLDTSYGLWRKHGDRVADCSTALQDNVAQSARCQ